MRPAKLILAVFAIGVLGTASAAAVHFGPRLYYSVVPPREHGHPIAEKESQALAEATKRFSGKLVWSSNRSGNHEIYLARLGDGSPRLDKLTNDPHVDSFPRFSPDAKTILFNRSRERWVSDRKPDPWDVWIMNADGSDTRRVAEYGFHASFAPDGKSVVFARGGQIVRHFLSDGREEVLLDSGRELGGGAQEPDLRGDRLAVTIRGRTRTFGVYDLSSRAFRRFEGDSCQIGWWPGKNQLLWIEGHRGNGGTRVATGSPDGKRASALIDLPGRYSHEYFPRLSSDGASLAWAASAGDHEPGRADYEIFLWKVGDPPDRALRLTYHTGNDQWPDLALR